VCGKRSRFNGFVFAFLEAAEAAGLAWPSLITGLKPGVNGK
jgi:hypothetical protein